MSDIKLKNTPNKKIKTINKSIIQAERFKDNFIRTKEKVNEAIDDDNSTNEYSSNKVMFVADRSFNDGANTFNKHGQKALFKTKDNYKKIKTMLNKSQTKNKARQTIKNSKNSIKTSREVVKNTQKIAKESIKIKQYTMKVAQKTVQGVKLTVKATISMVKSIIAGTKALISAIVAGGWIAVVVILVICLVNLLVGSVFGIFFSGEKVSKDSFTMKDLIAECNQEFSDKLQTIQDQNSHEDYVLDGSMAPWKDILLIYTVKISNGINEKDVITIDDNKKSIFKQIFWDMNILSSEVKEELVIERGINANESPKEIQKKVLHIKITPKSIDEMRVQYNFNLEQNKQLTELSDKKYSSLWNGVIYGSNSGEVIDWKQYDTSWKNTRIGNTDKTIGNIGCLVTSIAILIEKSGIDTKIKPFNPGTFVEALNKNGGFDNVGNLQYLAIEKVIPGFKYGGNINLREKTRNEKLNLITQYLSQGFLITIEVKGATPGNQHWVAVIEANGNDIIISDPATNQTNLWNAYEWTRTSQFNYFIY